MIITILNLFFLIGSDIETLCFRIQYHHNVILKVDGLFCFSDVFSSMNHFRGYKSPEVKEVSFLDCVIFRSDFFINTVVILRK